MKVLDVNLVLSLAGGAAKLRETMVRAGQPMPSFQRIHHWKMRDRIPGTWAGSIIWALACKGVNPIKLLRETNPDV